jgi:hypothetical protein
MAVHLTQLQLDRMNALRKMRKAFPKETALFKEHRSALWREIREQHGIPDSTKLRVGVETGVVIDAGTDKPWEPKAKRQLFLKLGPSSVADAVDDYAQNCDWDAHDQMNTDELPAGLTMVNDDTFRDAQGNYFVAVDTVD